MSNSINSAPRTRIKDVQRPLDLGTLGDGTVIIRQRVGTNGDIQILLNATLSATEPMKVKDGTVFKVRVTD